MAVLCGASAMPEAGMATGPTRDNQKRPKEVKAVAPKVLPFLHSMMPAMTWASPP